MSVAIDTVTIGSVEDRRLVLSNAQAARVISIGSTWNSLRISARISMSDSGGNILGTPRLCFGLLASPAAGMTNGPLTSTTSHFFGLLTAIASWTRQAGPPVRYIMGSATDCIAKRVGNTSTLSGAYANSMAVSGDPSTRRGVITLDIVKGSPNFTARLNCNTNTPGDVADKRVPLITGEMADPTLVDGYLSEQSAASTYTTWDAKSIAVNEAVDGYLNAVCIAWDQSNPTLHVSDLCWSRLT